MHAEGYGDALLGRHPAVDFHLTRIGGEHVIGSGGHGNRVNRATSRRKPGLDRKCHRAWEDLGFFPSTDIALTQMGAGN